MSAAAAAGTADAGLAGADGETTVEKLRRRLHDLKWHVPPGAAATAAATPWLREVSQLARLCSCDAVKVTAATAAGWSASLTRFFKSDDQEVVELAGMVAASLSGQGTYRQTLSAGGVDIAIQHHGFAGAGDTLGHQVWPSSLRMADLLVAGRRGVRGRRVVELGCGPGYPGLLAAALGAREVVLTDFEPGVLELARQNATANHGATGDGVAVAKLDWTADVPAFVAAHGPFDVVLAADCVYNVEHAAALAETITAVLGAGDAVAVVVLGDRKGRRGIELFEQAALARGLEVRRKREAAAQSEWILHRPGSGAPGADDPWGSEVGVAVPPHA